MFGDVVVSFALFEAADVGGSGFRFGLRRERLHQQRARTADPAPLAHQTLLPEQVRLHIEPIEPAHVLRGSNTP